MVVFHHRFVRSHMTRLAFESLSQKTYTLHILREDIYDGLPKEDARPVLRLIDDCFNTIFDEFEKVKRAVEIFSTQLRRSIAMYRYRATSMLHWGGPNDVYITLRMDLMPDSRESQSQRPPFPSTCRLHEQPLYIDFSVLIPLSPVPELHSILKGIFDLLPRPLLHPLFEVLNIFLCDSFSNCLYQIKKQH
jgi:hypothetical protein